jgi:hypothetical protein
MSLQRFQLNHVYCVIIHFTQGQGSETDPGRSIALERRLNQV